MFIVELHPTALHIPNRQPISWPSTFWAENWHTSYPC